MGDARKRIVAEAALAATRWKEDMAITNYDGERVWLGPLIDARGKRTGISDCCFVGEPCRRHRAVANGEEPDCEAEMFFHRPIPTEDSGGGDRG